MNTNLKISAILLVSLLFGCDETKELKEAVKPSPKVSNQEESAVKSTKVEKNDQLKVAVELLEKGMAEKASEKEFKLAHDVPYGASDLGYQVAVQQGWAYTSLNTKQAINSSELILVGRYFGKREGSNRPPEIRIRAIGLASKETKSLDWIKSFYDKWNVEVRSVNYESRYISDLSIRFQAGNENFLGRSMTRIADDKLFLVECVAAEADFEAYNQNCLYAMRTFKLDIEPNPK